MKNKRMHISRIMWISGTVLFFIAPVLLLFLKSMTFGWTWPEWRPHEFNLRAWEVMFRDPALYRALYVTVLIACMTVMLNFLLAVPAAYALSRFSFKGKAFVEAVLMMPILIPVLAVAMGMHVTMIRLGLTDSIAGVVIIHLLPTIPYAVRILKAGFDRLAVEWEEQSTVLGVGKWHTFRITVIPLIMPSLRSTAVLVFVISLSQYVLTAVIGGGRIITLPMIYYPYFTSADGAVVAGFSVLFALLPALFLIVFEVLRKGYIASISKP